jgi:two-component SAPR family response regulator
MMSELDQVTQQIAALQQEEQRLRQLSLEAQASLTQLSKLQGTTSLQRASLAWVEERERRYRDTLSQLLALLERRFELADELAKAQRLLEQLQRREALPDDDN